MKRALILLLLCCFLLTGCSSRQLEEELLVIVLAVDQPEEGRIRLTVKVPRNGAAQQEPGGDQSSYLLLAATGASFAAAVSLLNATTPRQLNYSQVREIVIGERMSASCDFGLLLMQLDALPRFRCSAAVIICRGEAGTFVDAQKPSVGARLSRHAETTLSTYAGKGFTPMTSLCEGMRDLGYGFRDPLFVLGAVNDFSAVENPNTSNALDALPGALPRRSADGIELFGAATTDGLCVSGTLTGYEMALIHLLDGHVRSLTLQQEQDVPLSIFAQRPAALSVDLSGRPAVLRVAISCEAHYPPGYPPDADALRNRLTQDISQMIHHLQSLRCDGIGFANTAVRQFLTVQDWEAVGWRDVYVQAEVEVQVTLVCREA